MSEEKDLNGNNEVEDISDEELEDLLLGESDEEEDLEEENLTEIIEEEKKTEKKKVAKKKSAKKDSSSYKFKHLKPHVIEKRDNIVRIRFEKATHTFLDLLSSTLLRIDNVEYAAYKLTSLEPGILTLITKEGVNYKDVLKLAIKKIKEELNDLNKAIQAAFK
ncbi:MAG: RpoL/Rpb11 RNA polymerase subunit family protein [Promethearchaeota archaeon]